MNEKPRQGCRPARLLFFEIPTTSPRKPMNFIQTSTRSGRCGQLVI